MSLGHLYVHFCVSALRSHVDAPECWSAGCSLLPNRAKAVTRSTRFCGAWKKVESTECIDMCRRSDWNTKVPSSKKHLTYDYPTLSDPPQTQKLWRPKLPGALDGTCQIAAHILKQIQPRTYTKKTCDIQWRVHLYAISCIFYIALHTWNITRWRSPFPSVGISIMDRFAISKMAVSICKDYVLVSKQCGMYYIDLIDLVLFEKWKLWKKNCPSCGRSKALSNCRASTASCEAVLWRLCDSDLTCRFHPIPILWFIRPQVPTLTLYVCRFH